MLRRDDEAVSFAAYVLPFVLYVVPTMFESSTDWLGLSYEVVCTLKGVLALAALWVFRRRYPAFSMVGFPLAVGAGVIGCVVWVLLARLQAEIPAMQHLQKALMQGNRVGYDPFAQGGSSLANIAFVTVRLIELIAIVPLAEEIFWRGFLARYLITNDFEKVRPGHFTLFSFVIVTLAFVSVHPEILAALVWGVMINLLYWKTGNLWACIVMHATTNGLLGGYILATQSWDLW
jgi:uncharacterized protein